VGRRIRAGLIAACAFALLAVAPSASADMITVSTTNNSGTGSLREVVDNAFPGDVVIVPPGTYMVTSDEINVSTGITIRGAGARRTIVRSDGTNRIFRIADSAGAATIREMAITGGHTDGSDLSDYGGAIRTEASDLTLIGVAMTDNSTSFEPPDYHDGGAVFVADNAANLVVRDSLFAHNTGYNGGAINSNGPITVVNSTFADNSGGSSTSNGIAGAIYASDDLTIRGVTAIRNRDFYTPVHAGAIYIGDQFVARDSIVSLGRNFEDNGMPAGSAGNPGTVANCDSVADEESANVENGTDCGFSGTSSRQGVDPRVASLQNNGGQTNTMRLLPGSPAINRGATCEPADQRGLSRALGGRCDIGAYELVRCGGVAVNRIGTSGKDTLRGTAKADGILALAGNDLLLGLAGNDGLCGGRGRDRLRGGKGRDRLLGGPGRDRLLGGPGRDRLRGGPGADFQRQ
jgi:hypothetical protein